MRRLHYLATGFAALAVACSDSPAGPSTPGTTVLTQDLADLAADGAAEDVGMMSTMDGSVPAFGAASLMGLGNGPRTAGCTLANGHFTCAHTRENGLDVDRTLTFFDASGATQTGYDNRTTASIHVVTSVTGDITRGPWSATVSRSRDFTVTGLAGAETTRTVNGTGSESVSRSGHARNGDERGYSLVGSSTVTNAVFPTHSEDSDPWPLSGTTTRTFTVTPQTGTPTTKTVVINFDGTSTPTGTVNGEPFTFDLTHRRAARR